MKLRLLVLITLVTIVATSLSSRKIAYAKPDISVHSFKIEADNVEQELTNFVNSIESSGGKIFSISVVNSPEPTKLLCIITEIH